MDQKLLIYSGPPYSALKMFDYFEQHFGKRELEGERLETEKGTEKGISPIRDRKRG